MRRLGSPAGAAVILLLTALAATVYFAAMRFVTEMAAQDARYRFERWEAGKAKPLDGEVHAALAGLRSALDFEPANPDLHWYLGRIQDWRARSGSFDGTEPRAVRETALASFRQVAMLRPTSGHAWGNIALTRYTLGQVDVEFILALEQTLRWAPWQPQLQLIGIQLGVATWQFMPLTTQMLVIDAIRRQAEWKMADQKPALIRLLRAYRRTELGCPWAGKALACPGF